MNPVLRETEQLNSVIRNSAEYRNYIQTKEQLYANPELVRTLAEFRRKNYDYQNIQGYNPYDEIHGLTREYDEFLHNSTVSNFLRAEMTICKLMQRVFECLAQGLEFDYNDE